MKAIDIRGPHVKVVSWMFDPVPRHIRHSIRGFGVERIRRAVWLSVLVRSEPSWPRMVSVR